MLKKSFERFWDGEEIMLPIEAGQEMNFGAAPKLITYS